MNVSLKLSRIRIFFLIIKTFYNNLRNELKPIVDKSKKPSIKLQDFFFGGIKALKSSVNNIN